MTDIRSRAVKGLQVGDSFSVKRTLTAQDVGNFAELSKDYNPVHFSRAFAEAKNFEGCICHGLLVATLLTEIGGQIGWLASGMNLKFIKPVYMGTTVRCDFTITSINDRGRATAEIVFTDETGVLVSEATISGILPNKEERAIMREMTEQGGA